MVAMARALMGRPRLLCMDEPTMGLSPLYVDRVCAI
jgi:branched-chain amino acid transport system ATP-binding protein